MGSLTAAVVGLGQMGRNHARVLQAMPGVHLTDAVDPRGDRTGVITTARVHTALDAVLASPPDVAVVAVPTVQHAEVACALLDAGVHVLVEKPIAGSVPDALAIAAAAARSGRVAGVGHIERFNPALRELRRRMDDGLLGEVIQITTSRQGPFPERIADVGVVHDLATHDLDLTRWIAGEDIAAVSAQSARRAGRAHEDLVSVTGRTASGIVVSHLVNWLSPSKERRTVVLGERGALLADTLSADLTWFANGVVATDWDRIAQFQGVAQGDVTRFAIAKREPLLAELEGFVAAVLGEEGAEVITLDDALETLLVAEAVRASAEAAGRLTEPASLARLRAA